MAVFVLLVSIIAHTTHMRLDALGKDLDEAQKTVVRIVRIPVRANQIWIKVVMIIYPGIIPVTLRSGPIIGVFVKRIVFEIS